MIIFQQVPGNSREAQSAISFDGPSCRVSWDWPSHRRSWNCEPGGRKNTCTLRTGREPKRSWWAVAALLQLLSAIAEKTRPACGACLTGCISDARRSAFEIQEWAFTLDVCRECTIAACYTISRQTSLWIIAITERHLPPDLHPTNLICVIRYSARITISGLHCPPRSPLL